MCVLQLACLSAYVLVGRLQLWTLFSMAVHVATWAVLAALAGINRDVPRADLSTRPGRRTGRSTEVPHILVVASPRVRFRNIFMCLPLVSTKSLVSSQGCKL